MASLPTEVFGPGNVTWWAALGGEIIEGFVLVLAVFAYLYLGHSSPHWPPLHTPLPSLGIPTLNLVLMLVSIAPAWWAARAARRKDRAGTLVGLVLHALIGTVIMVVRYYECRALNVRWDANAYGSITWALLFSHGYMALFDVFDTMGLALLCWRLEPEEKHYVDVTENSFFWYFVLATWVPLFVLVFLGPRWAS
ncbi:MAG: cytochrome c oxidase subunit 3 [Gemmatimonadaceae bacterium]